MPSTIPFIGHIIGVIRNKYSYYIQLRYGTRLTDVSNSHSMCSRQILSPIFTMTMPGTKMYIVTSFELIQAIQKQPLVLAFSPVAAKFMSNISGASAEAHKILMKNINGEEGDWGLTMESYASIRATLAPGPALDEMNRTMIQIVAGSLDALKPLSGRRRKINLGKWLFDNVTAATANSVYGPQHPFKDENVVAGFWYVLLRLAI